jgi:hypothetical protein
MGSEIEQLKAIVEKLQAEVTRLSGTRLVSYRLASLWLANGTLDQEDIRKLQYTYGYYLDKCLYKEVGGLMLLLIWKLMLPGRQPLRRPS